MFSTWVPERNRLRKQLFVTNTPFAVVYGALAGPCSHWSAGSVCTGSACSLFFKCIIQSHQSGCPLLPGTFQLCQMPSSALIQDLCTYYLQLEVSLPQPPPCAGIAGVCHQAWLTQAAFENKRGFLRSSIWLILFHLMSLEERCELLTSTKLSPCLQKFLGRGLTFLLL